MFCTKILVCVLRNLYFSPPSEKDNIISCSIGNLDLKKITSDDSKSTACVCSRSHWAVTPTRAQSIFSAKMWKETTDWPPLMTNQG